MSGVERNNAGTVVVLGLALFALAARPAIARSSTSQQVDNFFLTMSTVPGWVASSDNQVLILTRGKYVLKVNPIFLHASGVEGGRFPEVTAGMSAIAAVMRNVDQPAAGYECAETPSASPPSPRRTKLYSLYTDNSKTGNGCAFPDDGSAWFGATATCADEGECTITLDYDSPDVNALPKKGSPELRRMLGQVEMMLKTLHFKQFLSISKVVPESAVPGQTVTIYGTGFNIPDFAITVGLKESPDTLTPGTTPVADDGKSLAFKIPVSLQAISCSNEEMAASGGCLRECPPKEDGSPDFCGVATPAGTYHLWASLAGALYTNEFSVVIRDLWPMPVSVHLVYPNYLIRPDQPITVRGSGFTPTGNTVQVGSAIVENVVSSDGKTLVFKAPKPAGPTVLPHFPEFEAFVSNTNGKSNPIILSYRLGR